MNTLFVVVLQTGAIYLSLVVLVGIFTRRQMGQLNALDVLVMLMLGSAVETSMVQASTSLKAGLVSGLTLFVLNGVLTRLSERWVWLKRLTHFAPLVLISHGKFVQENLFRAGLTEEDVLHGIRSREVDEVRKVRYAVLEADGVISVIA